MLMHFVTFLSQMRFSRCNEASIMPASRGNLLIAFSCGYRNKYFDESGVWKSDPDIRASCLHGKLDVLKYCRKVHPHRNVTNIAELPEMMSISKWCPSGFLQENDNCHKSFEVRPYMCIPDLNYRKTEPELIGKCQLDQSEDRTKCQTYRYWHDNANRSCHLLYGKSGVITLFNVLQSCGLDLFTSYEYMCCDKNSNDNRHTSEESNEDQYEDGTDVIEVDASQITSHGIGFDANDPYYRKADLINEHSNYQSALDRLEETHKLRIDKVMKEWEKLEDEFLKSNVNDSDRAKNFRIRMTEQYRQTVTNLMIRTKKERYRLSDVHEQRLMAAFHESFNDASAKCSYMILHSTASNSKSSEYLRCYETLIRLVEKYRARSLNHFRHWLKKDASRARVLKSWLIRQLTENDVRLNNSLNMINRLPNTLAKKVKLSADHFWQIFRKEQAKDIESKLLWIGDPSNTQRIVEFYEREVVQEFLDDENLNIEKWKLSSVETSQHDAVQHALLRRENLHQQILSADRSISHSKSTYAGYWIFTIVGLALFALSIVLISVKKRHISQKRGFTIVDGYTPEERHISSMQIGGYINPTYKYFDNQA